MRSDIYLLITFDIKSSDFDALAALVKIMADLSKKEEGCLAYEFSVNENRTQAYMVEHFAGSSELVDHIINGASQYAEQWNSHLSLSNFIVIGDPSDELRTLLPPGANYVERVGGFTK